jgi:hypothetical protein
MLTFSHVATAVYVLIVFTAGYVGVSTVHGFFNETARMERLSTLGDTAQNQFNHTVLVMDRIEPSATE